MLRVLTVFTGYLGTPYYNTFYFNGAIAAATQGLVDDVGAFWSSALNYSTVGLFFTVQPEVYEIDPATGETVAATTLASVTDNGNDNGSTLPPATQGLIRLITGDYVDGRAVKGKVYIPALCNTAGGNAPNSTFKLAENGYAQQLVSDTAGTTPWGVWSKPRVATDDLPARAGSFHPITTSSVWEKYAVLRSRRD